MKKIVIPFLLITIFLFNSCSTIEGSVKDITKIAVQDAKQNVFTEGSESKVEACLEQVVTAVNTHDKASLKALFSKYALMDVSDMNDRIDHLFNFIQGPITSWTDDHGASTSEHTSDYGHTIENIKIWYYVYTDKEKYVFYLLDNTIDIDNPDNVGLYILQVIKAEDEDKDTINWFSDTQSAGIYLPPEATAAQPS